MIDAHSGIDANTAQHLRELEALHAASEQLLRVRDPEVLARDVITLLRDVMHHDFAAVYLVEGPRLAVFAVSDRGLGPGVLESDKAYLDSLDLRVGKHVTGWVAAHGESVCLGDVSEDDRYLDSQEAICSELCVPMFSGKRVFGVINLESTLPDIYGPSDQRVLEIVAAQIAIAIENSQLLARASETERLNVQVDLTSGIAHDLGNLLVSVALRCDLLCMQGTLSPQQEEDLRAMRDITSKAIALARGLLKIGLSTPPSTDKIDLNQHLFDMMPLIEAIGGRKMAVAFDACSETVPVNASSGQIDQILINLAVNANEAIRHRGQLLFRTRIEEEAGDTRVLLEVSDDGCGMDDITLASAMQPLFTTRADGSGLGLATVARLVEELDGRINLQSQVSEGTRVTISLPLAERKVAAALTL